MPFREKLVLFFQNNCNADSRSEISDTEDSRDRNRENIGKRKNPRIPSAAPERKEFKDSKRIKKSEKVGNAQPQRDPNIS